VLFDRHESSGLGLSWWIVRSSLNWFYQPLSWTPVSTSRYDAKNGTKWQFILIDCFEEINVNRHFFRTFVSILIEQLVFLSLIYFPLSAHLLLISFCFDAALSLGIGGHSRFIFPMKLSSNSDQALKHIITERILQKLWKRFLALILPFCFPEILFSRKWPIMAGQKMNEKVVKVTYTQ